MTPDVAVLVAASRQDHPHHEPALAWLDEALALCANGRSLAILPMVATGLLRLVTHPKVFIEPTPIDAALAYLRAILDSPGVSLLSLGKEWAAFELLCADCTTISESGYRPGDKPTSPFLPFAGFCSLVGIFINMIT